MTDSTDKAQDQEEAKASPLVDAEPDPRLDNRRGDARPQLEEFPAKPQQIDGGGLEALPKSGDEVAKRAKAAKKAVDKPKGAVSPGPHGLGDTSPQKG